MTQVDMNDRNTTSHLRRSQESEHAHVRVEVERLRHSQDQDDSQPQTQIQTLSPIEKPRLAQEQAEISRRSRILALVTVCTLSLGSHFAMYLLGPLKSRLHREMDTSNSQFSLLIASLSLNSTWTPLVGGLLIARFGTAWSSVMTTGSVLVGLSILFFGVSAGHLSTMAIGLFIFGLGMTPLAVVQETLLSHLSPTNHLGLSLALGLVSGKSASFISSALSLPIAKTGGDAAPFALALILAGISFGGNSARLIFGWGSGATGGVKKVVKWDGVRELGDVYWIYIILNVLNGAIWQPFIHLSANLVQIRFNLSESAASTYASTLLAGAIFLYPIIGYLTDRKRSVREGIATTFHLIITTSILTLLSYLYLCLPPSFTHTPWPGFILFALGNGAATLLVVVIVPRMVSLPLVPLGLGIHKAMETASATGMQTLAGLWLDWSKQRHELRSVVTGKRRVRETSDQLAVRSLIQLFALINLCQLGCVLILWRQEKRRAEILENSMPASLRGLIAAEEYERIPLEEMQSGGEGQGMDESHLGEEASQGEWEDEDDDRDGEIALKSTSKREEQSSERKDEELKSGLAMNEGERKRGRIALILCLGFIGVVWILFLAVAWERL